MSKGYSKDVVRLNPYYDGMSEEHKRNRHISCEGARVMEKMKNLRYDIQKRRAIDRIQIAIDMIPCTINVEPDIIECNLKVKHYLENLIKDIEKAGIDYENFKDIDLPF